MARKFLFNLPVEPLVVAVAYLYLVPTMVATIREASWIYLTENEENEESGGWEDYLALYTTVTEIVLGIGFVYFVIFKGYTTALHSWVALAASIDVILTGQLVFHIFIRKFFTEWLTVLHMMWMMTSYTAYRLAIYGLAVLCAPELKCNKCPEACSIGKGFIHLFKKMFCESSYQGIQWLLTVDTMVQVMNLVCFWGPGYLLGNYHLLPTVGVMADETLIMYEELYLRFLRILLQTFGLCFLIRVQEQKFWFKLWCLAYFVSFASSFAVYVIQFSDINEPSNALTLVYQGLFSADIIWRMLILGTGLFYVKSQMESTS